LGGINDFISRQLFAALASAATNCASPPWFWLAFSKVIRLALPAKWLCGTGRLLKHSDRELLSLKYLFIQIFSSLRHVKIILPCTFDSNHTGKYCYIKLFPPLYLYKLYIYPVHTSICNNKK
jgi:hypothetical protein